MDKQYGFPRTNKIENRPFSPTPNPIDQFLNHTKDILRKYYDGVPAVPVIREIPEQYTHAKTH